MEFIYMLRRLWKYAESDRWKIVVYYILHTISILGLLIQPYAFSMIINALQQNGSDLISVVLYWLFIYTVGFAVFNIFHRSARFIERNVAFQVKKRFIVSTYDVLQALPLQWHSENHSGNVIDRVNKAGDSLYSFGNFQAACIEVICKFIGAFIMLSFISPVISITAVLAGLFMIAVTKKLYEIIVPECRAQNEGFHKVSAALFDYIKNITTVIVLGLLKPVQKDISGRLDAILPHIKRDNEVTQIKCFVNDLIILLLNVGLIFYYIATRHSLGEVILAGSITAIFQYLGQLVSSIQFYSLSYEDIIHWNTNFSSMIPIYDAFERNESIKKSKQYDHRALERETERVNASWSCIDFGPINYSYGEGKAGLHEVKIHLNRGKKIAFIGESGAGKSTCLRIMKGLIPIPHLNLTIDGADSDIRVLENITTFIPQEPEIFENTIRYNITMGLSALQTEISRSALLASFDGTIDKLPRGYESDIRENGVNLSGGEKQRLALTRGIYSIKDSSLVFLDEPTGSLDSITEMSIYRGIFEEMSDKCIVSVLHRLHILRLFDYIYVFKDGRIVEEGTFEELMDMKIGEFTRLWNEYLLDNEG